MLNQKVLFHILFCATLKKIGVPFLQEMFFLKPEYLVCRHANKKPKHKEVAVLGCEILYEFDLEGLFWIYSTAERNFFKS